MEIDIEKYLSDEEIKDLVRDVVRENIQEKIRINGIDQFISNFAYGIVMDVVGESGAEKFKETLKSKMDECVEKNLSFYAFYEGRHLDRLMKEAIANHKDELVSHMLAQFKSREYDEVVIAKLQESAEGMMNNFYDVVEQLRTAKK